MSYNCDNNTILAAISKALSSGIKFYAYRMPGDKQLHFGAQLIDQYAPIGFYIHPFSQSLDCPSTYISAQIDAEAFLQKTIPPTAINKSHKIDNVSTRKEDYLVQADSVIQKMVDGEFKKVVLSRTIVNEYQNIEWTDVFEALLRENPNAFVFIFSTETTGTWMGASPERYLSFHYPQMRTMALAGTRQAGDENWGTKEIEEQAIVADYIAVKLADAKIEYTKSDTYTRRAGNVEHLCNDFTGKITSPSQVDKIKNSLHPTPALAGMPTAEAVKLIKSTEQHNRRYYGGYIGPINASGDFDFFVNLRSLEFDSEKYCIYVGGGLTADSVAESEWEETVQKSLLLMKHLH